jgi:hypothetical protein
MRQNGKDMGQSGKDMGQSYAKGQHNTLALLRRARRRANLNRKSSGNLTHILANVALVTHISAQVADLWVVSLNFRDEVLAVGYHKIQALQGQYFGHFLSERAEQTRPRTG